MAQELIQGVVNTPLAYHQDDRGYLVEILRASDPHFTKFGQVYLVGDVVRGTIRAFHKHDVLYDWFHISHGSAKFMLVDDRPDSPTYRRHNVFVQSVRAPAVLTVPPGVYHGWMALEDDTQLISIGSEVYRDHVARHGAPDEHRVPFDSFGVRWDVQFF